MTKINKYCNTNDLFLEGEIWKDIPNYEGKYQASNFGRIKTLTRVYLLRPGFPKSAKTTTEKILSPCEDKDGYLRVKLSSPTVTGGGMTTNHIHRLVALTFCNNPDCKPQVNHKDGNKKNNTPDNFEWVTILENINHAHRSGLVPSRKGIKQQPGRQYKAKWKPVTGTSITNGSVINYETISHALKDGFYIHHISACCKGSKPQHKGYSWRYVNS